MKGGLHARTYAEKYRFACVGIHFAPALRHLPAKVTAHSGSLCADAIESRFGACSRISDNNSRAIPGDICEELPIRNRKGLGELDCIGASGFAFKRKGEYSGGPGRVAQ